ncbi:MAG TPA: hypothetical protein VFE68_04345 [Vicinamibacteria bacterium]|nr:hypothetical protein [Vicinamibacteria bacterium]
MPVALPLLTIGAAALSRFAPDVRAVVAVGLSGAGFAIGVAFTILVFGLTGQLKE